MFALGLVKLFVAAVIVAVLWYGYRWIRSLSAKGNDAEKPDQMEMKACPVCGTYRPAEGASPCDREECPYK